MTSDIKIGIIPCAGRGMRISSLTSGKSKSLLLMGKKSILEYILDICAALKLEEIFIIIPKDDQQIPHFLKTKKYPFQINYITQEINNGIGNAISLVEPYLSTSFLVLLGDELFLNSRHEAMVKHFQDDIECLLGIRFVEKSEEIQKNYTLLLKNKVIYKLIEKPRRDQITNNILGTGSIIFTKKIFPAIAVTKPSPLRNEVELIDSINTLIETGGKVDYFDLNGAYVNINEESDVKLANQMILKGLRK